MRLLLASAAAATLLVVPAMAADLNATYAHRTRGHEYISVVGGELEVLGRSGGDTILSGRSGLHRSDFNGMVPDGTTTNFILSGRRYGSGLGANGLPGSNLDN